MLDAINRLIKDIEHGGRNTVLDDDSLRVIIKELGGDEIYMPHIHALPFYIQLLMLRREVVKDEPL